MSSTLHDRERASLQTTLDRIGDGDTLRLPTQELPGPIEISHPVTVNGRGTTIWALRGPVLTISSPGVTLSDLRVEVTGEGDGALTESCALYVKPGCDVRLERVTVRGSVIGLRQEEGEWRLPNSLQLGALSGGAEHDLLVRVYVPVACALTSNVTGIEVQPKSLRPGPNEVHLKVEQLPADVLLDGTLFVKTASLVRSVSVNAHVTQPSAPSGAGSKKPQPAKPKPPAPRVVWQPDDWDTLKAPTPGEVSDLTLPATQPAPVQVVAPAGGATVDYIPVMSGGTTVIPPRPPKETPPEERPTEVISWPPVIGGEPSVPSTKTQTPAGTPPATTPGTPSGTPTGTQPGTPTGAPPVPTSPAQPKPSRAGLYVGVGALAVVVLIGLAAWMFNPFGRRAPSVADVKQLKAISQGSPVQAVAFSPDGKTVAGGDAGGVVKLWDASTGEAMPSPSMKHNDAVTSVAFSPDGRLLASGGADGKVILFNLQQSGRPINNPSLGDRVNSVAFAPDGKTVACGVSDGKVYFVETQNGQRASNSINHGSPVQAVAFAPDGKTVATGGADGVVKLWNPSGVPKQPLAVRHNGGVLSLAFAPDGATLASGGADSLAVVSNLSTGTAKTTLRHTGPVTSLGYSYDGAVLAGGVGGKGGSVELWDLSQSQPAPKVLGDQSGAVNGVAVSPYGAVASGGADGRLVLWK